MPTSRTDRRFAIISIANFAILACGGGFFSLANAASTPLEIAQALRQPRAMGQSRLVVLGFNIYDAKLWVSEGFSSANYARESFALELRYLRNFSSTSIAERSLKEMRRLGEVSDETAAQWLAQMKQTFPDVKKGDQLIGIHRPDGTASFILNNKPIGEVRDEEFTRLFFGIWLSPKTSEPKMRSELIGTASTVGGTKR
jgi:Chalcone isomerase-like